MPTSHPKEQEIRRSREEVGRVSSHRVSKYTDEIRQIQASTGSPERKARQIQRREKLIQDAERMTVTSWYNTAVAYYNLSRQADARTYAEKVADDQQFGERAREILARLR